MILPPEKEKFTENTDLLTPWIDTFCDNLNHDIPDCNASTDIGMYNRVSLHNADGSLWYRFSVVPREPDSFIGSGDVRAIKKVGFVPFKTNEWNHRGAPARLILRITGESPNWYEVEINEQTRETKFAPKYYPHMWAKTSWAIGSEDPAL